MGCQYWTGGCKVPSQLRETIEAKIKEMDVGVYYVEEFQGVTQLCQEDGSVNIFCPERMDAFLDWLATQLKGTPEDGVLLIGEHDDGAFYMVLADGARWCYDLAPFEVSTDKGIGEEAKMQATMKIVGIGNGKGIVVGVPKGE